MLTVEDGLLAAAGGIEQTENYLFLWGSNTGFSSLATYPATGYYDLSWKQIESSLNQTLAIRSDDTLWTWGNNTDGQLGNNSRLPILSPAQIGTSSWVAIAAGLAHSMAIRRGGTLFTWGLNVSGQLGDGTLISRSSPYQIGTSSWTVLSAGRSTSMAIRSNGSLFTWGDGGDSLLGDNSLVAARSSPYQIGTSSWIAVSVGSRSAQAIRQGGSRFAWGNAAGGVLGIFQNSNTGPQANTSWTALSIAESFALGIKGGGTLFAWGSNDHGQLGNGTTLPQISPYQIGSSSWTAVCASQYSAWAIRQGGTLFAWGNGFWGQLGNGTNISRSSPVQIGTSSWSILPHGNANYGTHFAAIRQGGTLFTWGNNFFGQLGDGSETSRSSPVQIGTSSWIQVTTAGQSTLAIRQDNTLWSWGNNQSGVLGYPSTDYLADYSAVYAANGTISEFVGRLPTGRIYNEAQIQTVNPRPNFGDASWTAVSVGGTTSYGPGHILALTGPTLYAWGNNRSGQLGLGDTIQRTELVQVGTSSWQAISAGIEISMAIRQGGTLFVWGNNQDGQLGINDDIWRSSPTQAGSSSWSVVSAGESMGMAIRSDGRLFSWGNNYYSRLALLNASGELQYGIGSWTQVSSGLDGNLYGGGVLLQGNTMFYWGVGGYYGATNNLTQFFTLRSSPVFVQSVIETSTNAVPTQFYKSWIACSAGYRNVAAIDSDNKLWVWGSGPPGYSGVTLTSPAQIGTSNWTAVTIGGGTMAAIRQGGTLFAWGSNSRGGVGDGTNIDRSSPVQIGTSSWVAVSTTRGTSYSSMYAIRQGGTLFAWGYNFDGQVGDGTLTNRSSPHQIGTSSWTFVSGGVDNAFAIRSTGTLFGWGYNLNGQVGDGTFNNRSSPYQIGSSSWVFVSSSGSATAAIRSGGTLFTWGVNEYGLLGQGDRIWRESPVQIKGPPANFSWVTVGMGEYNCVGATVPSVQPDFNLLGHSPTGQWPPTPLWSWGSYTKPGWNSFNTSSPVQTPARNWYSPAQIGTSSWSVIATGHNNMAAIRQGGTLFTCGRDFILGFQTGSPVQVGSSSWTAVGIVAATNLFAIRQDGSLWAMGSDALGLTGKPGNYSTNTTSPVQISSASHIQLVSTGWGSSSFAGGFQVLRQGGGLWNLGQGTNYASQTPFYTSSPVQIRIPAPSNSPKQVGSSAWHRVSAAGDFFGYNDYAVALLNSDRYVYTWGSNQDGKLGYNGNNFAPRSSPQLLWGASMTDVCAGPYHWFAIDKGAFGTTALTAGRNSSGQIGNNTTAQANVRVFGASVDTGAFSPNAAFNFVWALPTGSAGYMLPGSSGVTTPNLAGVWAWGQAARVLGGGSYVDFYRSTAFFVGLNGFNSPVQVGDATSYTQVSASENNGYALALPGAVVQGWGWNFAGGLGLGTSLVPGENQWRNYPSTIMSASHTQVRALGPSTASAIRGNTGTLFMWGVTAVDGSNPRSSPTQVGTSSWVMMGHNAATLNNFAGVGIAQGGLAYSLGSRNATGGFGQPTSVFRQSFGNNASAPIQLGLAAYSSPSQIGTDKNWLHIASRNNAVENWAWFVIKSNGSMWAWGTSPLGDGTNTSRSSPTQVLGGPWKDVVAGSLNSQLALRRDNSSLWGWGANNFGQLGNGTTTSQLSPVPIGTSSWTAISIGRNTALAIRQGGTLFAWGYNFDGALGQNNTVGRSSPVSIGSSSWIAVATNSISATPNASLAIRQDGRLYAWGNGYQGSLGDNIGTVRSSPIQIGSSSWTAVVMGGGTALAIRQGGTLFAWGNNRYGQTGVEPPSFPVTSSPVWVSFSASGFTPLKMTGPQAFAIDSLGRLYATGSNQSGALGLEPEGLPGSSTQGPAYARQIGTSSWTAVAAGNAYTTMAIRRDGSLFTWGANSNGTLGDGSTTNRSSPVQIGTSSWSVIASVVSANSMAIRQGGTLFTWGWNFYGTVGDGTNISRSSPVQIGTSSWIAVGMGPITAHAIRQGGTLFGWGYNGWGSVGDGTNIDRSSPVQIGTSSWIAVSANEYWTAAIRQDGALFGWGQNQYGQLGLGDVISRSSPTLISSSSWIAVHAGNATLLALRQDSTLWATGLVQSTSWYLLPGNTGVSARSVLTSLSAENPSTIGALTNISQITNDGFLTSSGQIWFWNVAATGAWGRNEYLNGSLNNITQQGWQEGYTNAWIISPVQIGTSSWTAVRISNDGLVLSARRADGTLWTWGYGEYAALGNLPMHWAARSSPVQIAGSQLWLDWDVGTYQGGAISEPPPE